MYSSALGSRSNIYIFDYSPHIPLSSANDINGLFIFCQSRRLAGAVLEKEEDSIITESPERTINQRFSDSTFRPHCETRLLSSVDEQGDYSGVNV